MKLQLYFSAFRCIYKDCYVGEIPSPSSKLLRRSDGAISPAKRTFICSFQAIEEARKHSWWFCIYVCKCKHSIRFISSMYKYPMVFKREYTITIVALWLSFSLPLSLWLQSNELLSQVRSSFSRHVQLFDITFHLQGALSIWLYFF